MIVAKTPAWATILNKRGLASDWLAYPPLHSGEPTPAVIVRITVEKGWVYVAEAEPGTRLPAKCPQLHINTDSTFCLAYRSYRDDSELGVLQFWQDLGEYLVNQHFARSRRRWPSGRWMSHGPLAADRQLEAERQARKLKCYDAYQECLELNSGWIARLVTEQGAKVSGALYCPLGCVDGSSSASSLRSCGHLFAIRRLIKTERERQGEEERFFKRLKATGHPCCDRANNCPLKTEKEAA